MSLISATSWVPKGFASQLPVKYDFDDEEMDRLAGLARLQLEEAQDELEEEEEEIAETSNKEKISTLKKDEEDGDLALDEDLKEYDLEHYDDDDDDANKEDDGEGMAMFSNIKNLVYHANGEDDPYITLPSKEEEEEERREWEIYPTDNLILATKTEEEVSTLEVYVYDDKALDGGDEDDEDEDGRHDSNLYIHHDIMLPSFPLCVEWLDFRVGKAREGHVGPDGVVAPGNFAAVGTFEPEIELWNVDAVDSPLPDMILGAKPDDDNTVLTDADKQLKKKKKKKAIKKKINDQYHIDAVLALAANRVHRNLLVSGSADTTVKLWDLNEGVCARSLQLHDDKVSSVRWNPEQGTVLLSGGFDRRAVVSDLRAAGSESARRSWSVESDIEGVKWDRDGVHFYVGTESGIVHKFDARVADKSVWKLQAHDSEVSTFDVNPHVDGFMVTGSSDKTIKLWDLSSATEGGKGPSMILSRDLDVGKVFSVGFAPDREVLGHIVVAGASGKLKVWDSLSNRTVYERIGRKYNVQQRKKEKLAEAEEDDEEEEEDDDDEFAGNSSDEDV